MWVYTCASDPALNAGSCPDPQWIEWETLFMQSMDFAAVGIDPATILYVFAWGAGAVLSMWAIGYAVGVATRVIRQA